MFGCCYLPGLPHCLAAAGPVDAVSLFNAGTGTPTSSSRLAPAAVLSASGIPSRQLLCIACAADGSAMAASGVKTAAHDMDAQQVAVVALLESESQVCMYARRQCSAPGCNSRAAAAREQA